MIRTFLFFQAGYLVSSIVTRIDHPKHFNDIGYPSIILVFVVIAIITEVTWMIKRSKKK